MLKGCPPASWVSAGNSARIPCLDGLRALSILAVAFGHLQGTAGFPSAPWMRCLGDLGNLGVRGFFVISGFLITHLLIQESRATGRISIQRFYIRRIFRICPAFYTYLIVIAALSAAGVVVLGGSDFGYAAAYVINFVEKKSWVVGHLWSLAVEEQFYLLWPLIILVLGWRRATITLIGVVMAAPLVRIGCWYLLPDSRGIITKAFPTICDAIAVGCVLARLRDCLSGLGSYHAFISARVFLVVPAAILISNALAFHTRPDYLVGQSVRNIGLALCLDWCLRYPDSIIGKLLNLRVAVWLGAMSYSFYLWQQPFLNRKSEAVWCAFPLNIGLALLCAAMSFYFVEKPFLRLRLRMFPALSK